MTLDQKTKMLEQIRDEVVNLTTSPLFFDRQSLDQKPVVGQGNLDAKIMLIGEAPGAKEAQTGVPFCGASGKFLDIMLEHIKLSREEVYITNLVNDRPPKNRDPKPEEIALYTPFLERQIDIISPKVIVTLGRLSMKWVFEKYGLIYELVPIGQIHGQEFETIHGFSVVALYHPAVALYNGGMRETLKKDFEILSKF